MTIFKTVLALPYGALEDNLCPDTPSAAVASAGAAGLIHLSFKKVLQVFGSRYLPQGQQVIPAAVTTVPDLSRRASALLRDHTLWEHFAKQVPHSAQIKISIAGYHVPAIVLPSYRMNP